MAGGVNVKMGVSGVAQFKQSINQAKQNIKTLDAQLTLTEKQFKATGDAETYMQQKAEQLKAKMEEQQRVIDQTSSALNEMASKGDTSSKAYQQMIQQLAIAKGDLIDTEQALAGVGDQATDVGNNVDHMNYQLKRIGEGVSYDNVTNALGKINDGMEKAIKKAVELGKKIVKNVLGAGSWADDLHTRATYYGISDEDLQRAEKTAQLIDTPVEAIMGAQKKLRLGIGKADKGVMGAFAELLGKGYDPEAKGWEQAFWDAGEAIMKFGNAEEKEVYAQKLFGRSWNELIPLFEAGRKEYDKLNKSWNVVPQEQMDALTQMDDAYQTLQNEIDTLEKTFAGELAPTVKSVLETLTGFAQTFNTYLQSEDGKKAMEDLGNTFLGWVDKLGEIDPAEVIGSVEGAFDWIVKNKGGIITALEGIGAAFAGLKIIEIGTNIGKVVNGLSTLKGLFGGGGGESGTPTTGGQPSGGFWTGAGNALTNLIPNASNFMSVNGGSVWDWLTHESPLAGILNGSETVGDALARWGKEIEENSSTFEEDWKNNELVKFWTNRNDNADAANRLPSGQNWLPSHMQGIQPAVKAQEEAAEEIAQIAEDVQQGLVMTPEQRTAAEKFWDAYRENPSDFSDDAWTEFENAFAGQEDLFNALNDAMDEIVQGVPDNSWTAIEDLPESMFMEVAQPMQNAADDISGAADKMGSLPQKVAAAVRGAVSGMSVVLNGDGLAAAVGQILAGGVMNG